MLRGDLPGEARLDAEGVGAAVTIDGLVPEILAKRLAFRPFEPAFYSEAYLAWKEKRELAPAAAALVRLLRARVTDCQGVGDYLVSLKTRNPPVA